MNIPLGLLLSAANPGLLALGALKVGQSSWGFAEPTQNVTYDSYDSVPSAVGQDVAAIGVAVIISIVLGMLLAFIAYAS